MRFGPFQREVTLSNGAERRFAAGLAEALPTAEHPSGVGDLFIAAPQDDIIAARDIAPRAHALGGDVHPNGPGRADQFTVEGGDFDTLVHAAFLAGVQPARINIDGREVRQEEQSQPARTAVEDANLFNILLLRSNLAGAVMEPPLNRLADRYYQIEEDDRKRLAGAAAVRLLVQVGLESGFEPDPAFALRAYHNANPDIVTLSNYRNQ